MKHLISGSVLLALALMLVGAGCKKETQAGGNELPKVIKAQFATPGVMPGDSIRIVVEVSDKEGDQAEIEYEWLVDNKKVAGANGPLFETGSYGSGAKVTVRFRVKEVGSGRFSEWGESSLVLGAPPPVTIAGVSIEPDPLVMGQNPRAVIDYGEADSNDFTLYYRWFINGKVQEGEDFQSEELDGKYLKRGDQVMVEVSEDDEFKGGIFRSLVMPVTNNPPVFTTEPYVEVNGNIVMIKYEAEDPDGDNLTYSVSGAPAGYAQDDEGFRFNISGVSPGEYNMTVIADDGKGATASYEVTMTVPEPEAPAPAEEPGEPTGEGE